MEQGRQFNIIYASQVKQHLRAIDRKYYSIIRKTIEKQLRFQPNRETRNRKPLKRPIEINADWEIRFGHDNMFRVFYDVNQKHYNVNILAVGIKQGNRLFIGGEEIEL